MEFALQFSHVLKFGAIAQRVAKQRIAPSYATSLLSSDKYS
ncbi:MAG: hypothetical protein WBB28_14795 [Crinalium sp.]